MNDYPDTSAGVVVVGGCNHLLHAILTVLTCGLWFPVWFLAGLFDYRRVLILDRYGNVIAVRRL